MSPSKPDFAAARRAMIDSQLRPQGVTDRAVLAAMASVSREQFVPEEIQPIAYSDRPLTFGNGQALMPPAALAKLLTELQPHTGERALVIGSGNGYAPAVLEALGLTVDAAEGIKPAGKGEYGVILIDGAVEEVPAEIASRLAPGGRLGAALFERGVTRLAIGRISGGVLGFRRFADSQVPMLPEFTRPRVFTF